MIAKKQTSRVIPTIMTYFAQGRNFSSIQEAYQKQVASGKLNEDKSQLTTLNLLESLKLKIETEHHNWLKYSQSKREMFESSDDESSSKPKARFFSTFFNSEASNAQTETKKPDLQTKHGNKIKGLYLYGKPGSGKTFLMDMFYNNISIKEKERIHFNEFMLNVHQRLHSLNKKVVRDPLKKVASDIASTRRVLCFDEFQVTDIADAMILKQLFQILFADQVILVTTSNRPPEDLYYNGLQRSIFLPFIDLLKEECVVHNIGSDIDYRYSNEQSAESRIPTLIHPIDSHTDGMIEGIFQTLTYGQPGGPRQIEVMSGRLLSIPKASNNGVALFDFEQLLQRPLGSMDFIAICRNFHSVVLKNVPKINLEEKNLTRRFILLVDELYNHKTKLYLQSARTIENIFNTQGMESSSDELFAIERCISRLTEMQSRKYMEEKSYYDLAAQEPVSMNRNQLKEFSA